MSLQMQYQRGSALISVMVILLLTTVLGVIAVRQGSTNLNLAMNASVQSLLVQSSDVGLSKFEDPAIFKTNANGAGPLGYLRLSGNEAKEYVFCYRPTKPTDQIFEFKQDPILLPTGGTEGNVNGFCDTNDEFSYSSGRRVVVSQLALARPQDASAAKPFQYYEKGTDGDTVKRPEQQRFRAYITSIAPTLAQADKAELNKCFELANDDSTVKTRADKESMSDCFFRLGVPSSTQVQEYILGGVVKVEKF